MRKHEREHVTETPDTSHIANVDVTHEQSDVNVRSILWFVFGLLVLGVFVHVLMWLMFRVMESRAAKLEPPPAPMAYKENERLPPEPRLQAAPGFGVDLNKDGKVDGADEDLSKKEPQSEYKVMRAQWEETLRNGPADQQGHKGLPIDEAMKRVAAQGLPVRPQQGQQQQQGEARAIDYAPQMPTYQSSGRMMEKRSQ
ncbi:MAG: hypothetical protein WCB68_08675 [Pyrinomonadaceae bacterium]